MKHWTKLFPVEMLKHDVIVFFGPRKELKKYLAREKLTDSSFDLKRGLENAQAICILFGYGAIVYAENPISEGVLTHEIIHAAKHILKSTGVKDEEALCYLVEYLYDNIVTWARTTPFIIAEE